MKRHLMLIATCCLLAASLRGQADTVLVTGTVHNLHTRRPHPYCLVQMLQGGVAKAMRVADAEGYFHIDSLPAGTYTLHLSVGILPLYTAELDLTEDANLSLFVDTLRMVDLRAVTIRARRRVPGMPRHMLGAKLITSANDPRLWDFHGTGRDASASVAEPMELHPLFEEEPLDPFAIFAANSFQRPSDIIDQAVRSHKLVIAFLGNKADRKDPGLPFWERERIGKMVTRQINAIIAAAYWQSELPSLARPR